MESFATATFLLVFGVGSLISSSVTSIPSPLLLYWRFVTKVEVRSFRILCRLVLLIPLASLGSCQYSSWTSVSSGYWSSSMHEFTIIKNFSISDKIEKYLRIKEVIWLPLIVTRSNLTLMVLQGVHPGLLVVVKLFETVWRLMRAWVS